MQTTDQTILTAYIISASRDFFFFWSLKFHHAFYYRGRAWCFAGSVFKFPGFALIVVILPAFRLGSLWRPAGADPGIFDWEGPNFGSERTVGLLWGKLLSPTPAPSHQSRLYVIIPWPLTVYLDSTRKGCTLGTSSSCVWLQKLYRFHQHQREGHDVSASVEVLTTAYLFMRYINWVSF